MKKLVLETTAPFQGLPELVAYGRRPVSKRKAWQSNGPTATRASRRRTDNQYHQPEGRRFRSPAMAGCWNRGRPTCTTRCEWGNYCRVQDTGRGFQGKLGGAASSPMGRSWVRPDSDVYTAQAAREPHRRRCRSISAPIIWRCICWKGFSTARTDQSVAMRLMVSRPRFDSMMKGEIEATTLTEPYITLAEKKGCRHDLLGVLSRHGSRLRPGGTPRPMARFNRAVRAAVKRINRQ